MFEKFGPGLDDRIQRVLKENASQLGAESQEFEQDYFSEKDTQTMDDTRWGGYGDKFPFGGEGPRSPADEEAFKQANLSIRFDEGDDCPECGEELVARTNQQTSPP